MQSNQKQHVKDCIQAAANYAADGFYESSVIKEFLETGRLAWSDGSIPVASDETPRDALYRDAGKKAIRHLYDGLAKLLPVGARQVPSVAPSAITNRIYPMVIGLLPADWQGAALNELTRRIFVLTFDGTKAAIEAELSTGWGLSHACQLLWSYYADYEIGPSGELTEWDSFSSGAFAHVRWGAFKSADPYGDAVVHEGAHLLYFLKPSHYGLQVPRGHERFVDVAFRQRRLFAFACEAFSQVLKHHDRESRLNLADRMHDEAASFPKDILDEVATLVRAAGRSRNGWRVILDANTEDRTRRKHRHVISA